MGCVFSKQLKHEEFSFLASQTFFNEDEVEVLHELFIKLTSCLNNDNFLTKENFQYFLTKDTKRPSLCAEQMFGLFDMRNDGVIDFEEFVHSLNIFHPNSSQRNKAIFAFRLYDTHQNEVKEMVIDFVEESELILPESIIDSIVSKSFEEEDWKKDGKIDLEE